MTIEELKALLKEKGLNESEISDLVKDSPNDNPEDKPKDNPEVEPVDNPEVKPVDNLEGKVTLTYSELYSLFEKNNSKEKEKEKEDKKEKGFMYV